MTSYENINTHRTATIRDQLEGLRTLASTLIWESGVKPYHFPLVARHARVFRSNEGLPIGDYVDVAGDRFWFSNTFREGAMEVAVGTTVATLGWRNGGFSLACPESGGVVLAMDHVTSRQVLEAQEIIQPHVQTVLGHYAVGTQ